MTYSNKVKHYCGYSRIVYIIHLIILVKQHTKRKHYYLNHTILTSYLKLYKYVILIIHSQLKLIKVEFNYQPSNPAGYYIRHGQSLV